MTTTMNCTRILGLSIVCVLLLLISVQLSYSCNEQVCASIVSKCMLTQSCKCDLKNCSCCSECFKCLSHLSTECCSCVGKMNQLKIDIFFHIDLIEYVNVKYVIILEMCPKPSDTRNVSRQSHVGDLEGIPGLFQALTEVTDEDDQDKWTIFTFPVDVENVLVGSKGDKEKYILRKCLKTAFQLSECNLIDFLFFFLYFRFSRSKFGCNAS